MKDLPVHGDKLFDKAQKRIESMNADPEWRDTIMDFETRMLEREQVGEKKGLKTGALTLVASLKDVGCTSQQILQQLKQKYGNVFSDKQLEEFLKQSQVITTIFSEGVATAAPFLEQKKNEAFASFYLIYYIDLIKSLKPLRKSFQYCC